MALESTLDADTGLGGGGLVIWLNYSTLYVTAEWLLDYYHDVCDLDTAQTDALDELFINKKGWEGAGAEQYKELYNSFIDIYYLPEFETRLSNLKGITVDAVVGAGKLINQCDDFYLSLESDDYEPEIRMGRSLNSYGVLKYDWCFKETIINHCEAANTATEEEDKLIDEAIEAISDVNFPEFVIAINSLAEEKDTFIKKQKRIKNYEKTFKDYTERVVQYDQDVADAYNVWVNENVRESCDYTPISVVPPWEVDCANIWKATGNTDAMIDFIQDAPKSAYVWNEGTAEALAIIFQDATDKGYTRVEQVFKDKYYKTEYVNSKTISTAVADAYGASVYGSEDVTFDNYVVKVDPVVFTRMKPYLDEYMYGTAWTTLTSEQIHVTVARTGNDKADIDTVITVKKGDDGSVVTTVNVVDSYGNDIASESVIEDNQWRYYGNNKPREMRLNGATKEEIDEYVNSDQGKLDLYGNPYYKMTDEEEKEAKELIEKFWEEHPELEGFRTTGDVHDMYLTTNGEGMTFEEWLRQPELGCEDINMDDYYLAVQYYNLEHKMSDWDAFYNGASKSFNDLIDASQGITERLCGETDPEIEKLLYGVPSEQELAMQAEADKLAKERELARQASILQNPHAYSAGYMTDMYAKIMFAGNVLEATGAVEAASSWFGGSYAAEKVTEAVLETAFVDIPTDTIPEAIDNYNSGMSADEVFKNAAINVFVNAGINIGAGVVPSGVPGQMAKPLDDTDYLLKTSSDGLKMAENVTDAGKVIPDVIDEGKAIPDVTGAAKLSDNGNDVVKMADDVAVAEKTADVAKTSDLGKSADNVADSSKFTGETADATKIASNVAESGKTVERIAEPVKTAEHAADTAKTAEHAADTAKTAEYAVDTEKAAGHAIDAEKAADHAVDAEKTADHAIDTEKAVDHATDSAKDANDDLVDAVHEDIDSNNTFEDDIIRDDVDRPNEDYENFKNVTLDSNGDKTGSLEHDNAYQNKKPFENYTTEGKTRHQNGNYSEYIADNNMKNNPEIKKEGYGLKSIGRPAPTSPDCKIEQGFDGFYKNEYYNPVIKPADEGYKKGFGVHYVVDEAKYNTATLRITKIDGKQMSDSWITGSGNNANHLSRIYRALIGGGYSKELAKAEEKEFRKALKLGQVDRVYSHVASDGTVTTYKLDNFGNKISNGEGGFITWP